jgi:putative hydrolase of the HAD superfamily
LPLSQKINAILFDLDGTLRHSQPASENTFFNIAVEFGAANTRQTLLEGKRWAHKYWAQSETMLSDFEAFSGLTKEFWINYAQRHLVAYGVPESQAQSVALDVYHRMESLGKPEDVVYPQVYDTLFELKKAGYILGIVSNRTYSFLEQLEKLNLSEYMSCVVAGGEVGLWKPQPEIFYLALEKIGLRPQETVFVGDNYFTDIVGSRNAGICSILLDPEGVFPDPGCEVISCLSELKGLLDQ